MKLAYFFCGILVNSIFILNPISAQEMPDTIKVPFVVVHHLRNVEQGASVIFDISTVDKDDVLQKTYKKITGIPKNWNSPQFGKITFDLFQDTYQEYKYGHIGKKQYYQMKSDWGMDEDPLYYSKNPLINTIYVAWGKDELGKWKYKVDINNNHSMEDEEEIELPVTRGMHINATAPIHINFEDYIDGKKVIKHSAITLSMDEDGTMLYQDYIQGRGILPYTDDSFALQANYADFLDGNIHLLKDTLSDGNPNLSKRIIKGNYYNFNQTPYQYLGIAKDQSHLLFAKYKGAIDTLYSNQIGYKMRPIEGEDFVTKKNIASDKLESEYVLVNFWGSWCLGCILDKPYMIAAYDQLDKSNIQFLSVATDDSATLMKILHKDGIKWPQIQNTDKNNIVEKNKIEGFPTNLLLNKHGVVIANYIGDKEQFHESILKIIEEYEKKQIIEQ